MTDPIHGTPPSEPRLARGRRLALDVGTVRIGVALSDPDGILATPLTTVQRQEGADVRAIAAIVDEESVAVVYVGLPRTLGGGDSASTALARKVAAELAGLLSVEVRFVDERLSTVDASRMMRESGRPARRQRAAIDAAAAVVILQTALDAERVGGTRSGERVHTAGWTPEAPIPARKPRHRKSPRAGTSPTQEGTS